MTDIRFADRAAYLGDADALVLGDCHIGASEGSLDAEVNALLARIDALCAAFSPQTIAIHGDLYEIRKEHPVASPAEHAAVARFLTALGERAEVVVTRGNHEDRANIARDDLPVPLATETMLADDRTVVSHGHELPHVAGDRYIVGHSHPHTEDGAPCYLHGKGGKDGAEVVVLPPFNPAVGGPSIAHVEPCFDRIKVIAAGDHTRLRPTVVR